MNSISESLNPEQQKAVTNKSRYLQIIAGPGTGKTTALAAKILYTQSELGINTDNILGISFSRAAKIQLLNKLEEFTAVTGFGGKPAVRTFHSLAHQIIRLGIRYNESRFRSGFQRIDTVRFVDLYPTLTKDLCPEYTNRDVVNIALAQTYNTIRQGTPTLNPVKNWTYIPENDTFSIRTYEQGRIRIEAKDLKTYWKRVSKIEELKNVTDFQGLISEAIRLLALKKHTYKHIANSYSHIFVDEYQDTSLAQEEMLFSVINTSTFVTVVGDKNQTIYTFNGSNNENMDRFVYKCKEIAPLDIQTVNLTRNYRSTKEIIHISNQFLGKNVIVPTSEHSGLFPEVIETHSIGLAAEFIAIKIKELQQESNARLSDICVLYRKNSTFSPQADELYKQLGKFSIPYNSQIDTNTDSLATQVLSIQSEYEDELLTEILKKLKADKDPLLKLITFIENCINQGATEADDLSEYLVELEEDDLSMESHSESVTVKTIHNAKGQEYPIVFILYLGDREFPHSSRPDIEEEKRLLYVGLTRAQERLFILGEKGIEFESFLDKCHVSDTLYIKYHSSKEEEKNEGFAEEDKALIDQTTKQHEKEEKRQQEELQKLMDFF